MTQATQTASNGGTLTVGLVSASVMAGVTVFPAPAVTYYPRPTNQLAFEIPATTLEPEDEMATNAEIASLKAAIEKLTAEVSKKEPWHKAAFPYVAAVLPLIGFFWATSGYNDRLTNLEKDMRAGFQRIDQSITELKVSVGKIEVRQQQAQAAPPTSK